MSRLPMNGSGFTLLELLTVTVIISILAVMLFPLTGALRERAEKVKCVANLRTLHIATNAYLQSKGSWPQVSARLITADNKEYARQWISALAPFDFHEKNWACPTVQRLAGNPNLEDPKNPRIDYVATPFDDKQFTPFKWATQPWFAERGDVHGDGNLTVFADGSVKSLGDIVRKIRSEGGSAPKKRAHQASNTISIAPTIADATEGGSEGILTVTRTGETDSAVTVKYSIGGSATNGVDYAAIEQEVTIPAGSDSAKIHIAAVKDAERENAETVSITLLSSSGGYKIAEPRAATVTIHDADEGN